ncbi:hypothetical protein Y1Q_0019646 [Alligator mississippiensis]|uniref:Uncharacterized protein n=1 Tax=Alligator mississippiensis TaxID=8496 RepID=A0A151PEV6_ALLMI|nr:hypothetical protein Y1Q_0019646 [Alligator mississippiensis]
MPNYSGCHQAFNTARFDRLGHQGSENCITRGTYYSLYTERSMEHDWKNAFTEIWRTTFSHLHPSHYCFHLKR